MNMTSADARAPSALPRFSWWWCLLPMICAAGFHGLWAPDEPRYAMIARWIYENGEFLVLRRCGELYADKPPLVYWIAGLLGHLTDWNVAAMRAVSVLAIAGTAWMTGELARSWLGEREGRWAPLLFVGFALILWNGSRIALDPLLTFGCVGGLYFASQPARDARHARTLALLAGTMVSIGMLSKGPPALLNAGLPLIAWRIAKTLPGGARASLGAIGGGVLLAIVPVAAWAAAASFAEPALAEPLFFGQHIGRAASGTQHHGPPWQNLLQVPLLTLPWTVPVLFGVVDGWRAWRAHRGGDESQAALARVWLWAMVLFVVFSAIPAKRELYLMSAYPAFAMLGAHRLVKALQNGAVGRWSAAVPLALFFALGLAMSSGTPVLDWLYRHSARAAETLHELPRVESAFPDMTWRGVAAGLPFLVGAWLGWRAWRARRWESWASGVAATWCVGTAAVFALVAPALDVVKSDRDLAALVASLPQKPDAIPCYNTNPEGPRFYGAGPCVIADVDELRDGRFEQRAAAEGDDFLALVRESNWEKTPPERRERFRVVAELHVGSRELLLVGMR